MLEQLYRDIVEIGQGRFSTVYKAQRTADDKIVALKIIKQRYMTDKYEAMINNELDTMIALSSYPDCNKHIVCFYSSRVVDDMLVIEEEFIHGVDLFDFVTQFEKLGFQDWWTVKDTWDMMLQLAVGLEYIHRRGYAHVDIKLENIMRSNDGTVKYLDLGLACSTDCVGGKGTPIYMPPERLQMMPEGLPYKTRLMMEQWHDIWSLGIVFYALLYQTYPYNIGEHRGEFRGHEDYESLRDLILSNRLLYPHTTHDNLKFHEVINRMLAIDAQERISAWDLIDLIKKNRDQ